MSTNLTTRTGQLVSFSGVTHLSSASLRLFAEQDCDGTLGKIRSGHSAVPARLVGGRRGSPGNPAILTRDIHTTLFKSTLTKLNWDRGLSGAMNPGAVVRDYGICASFGKRGRIRATCQSHATFHLFLGHARAHSQ